MTTSDFQRLRVFDIGDERAPVGSEAWAKRVRVRMQSIADHVGSQGSEAESLRRAVEIMQQHRAWTLLDKDKEGISRFATWEEFCETAQPYGLGRPWSYLRPFVEAVTSKEAVQLATVAPGSQGNRSDLETSYAERTKSGHTKDAALRAILRAPVEVQDLYRDGLISQKVAAKLGPKNPAKAPSREAIVSALKDIPRERKAIDCKVREVLGRKRDRVAELVRTVRRLSPDEFRRFKAELNLIAKGA